MKADGATDVADKSIVYGEVRIRRQSNRNLIEESTKHDFTLEVALDLICDSRIALLRRWIVLVDDGIDRRALL